MSLTQNPPPHHSDTTTYSVDHNNKSFDPENTSTNQPPSAAASQSDEKNPPPPTTQTPTPPATAKPSPPPDGGRDAWLTVLGGWAGAFVSFGWLNSVGVFQEYYEEGPLSAYNPSDLAWIASTEIFFMFVCAPLAGKIFDSYGPRGLLLVGSFMHVFGVMMMSLGHRYYEFFLAQSVCSAIGAGLVFYAVMNSVSTWFLKKRATALGIMVSGSSLGGVLLPIMITRMIPEIGFGWAVRVVGFLFFFLCVVAILTTRSRLTHVPKKWSVMEFFRPLAEAPFAVYVLGSFFFFFGTFLPYNFLILQGEAVGTNAQLAQYLIPLLNAGSLPGRILPGMIADRFGRYNMIISMTILSAIFVLGIWLPAAGPAPVIVFAVLYGFTSGAFISLGPAVVAQISEIKEIGIRNGTLYMCVSIGALIGNPIGGALIDDDHGGYHYMQILCGVAMAAGFILIAISRVLKVGVSKAVF